jgi:magnesium transporter
MVEIDPKVTDTEKISINMQIRQFLEDENAEGMVELLDPLPVNDALREILQFSADERDQIFSILPPELAAELIDEAPHELAADLIERLSSNTAADIIEELDSDAKADVISEMDDVDAEAILAEMDVQEAADVRRLASYDDDTAGGLMVAELFTFNEKDTVSTVLKRLSSEEEDFERFHGHHPYVINEIGQPIGVISLRGLLTARRSTPLLEIMVVPLTVDVNASIDELRDIFDEYDFLGLPVVETNGELVGVVSRAAVDEAALDRIEQESLKRHGVVGDEVRSMPYFIRSRRRLAWLTANIVLNVIAASVISAYEDVLTAVIAIAIFLPMVSDMSGCSGNQAVAVTLRELSLGLVKPIDAYRVWIKEVSVGLLNGFVLGLLIGLVAWLWKDNFYLGLVIGLALTLNTIVAVSIGGVVPLLLKRIGQDPAVASGPLLTTITDMAGFFFVLSLATLFMPLLI